MNQNKREMKNRMHQIITIISIGLFIFALTQKCYCTTESCGDSIAALLSGAIGFVLGGAALTWLANPLLVLSWIIGSSKPRLSFLFSILAFIISLSFLLFKKVVSDEAGNYKEIVSYQMGYWLWLASSFVMVIANTIRNLSISSQPG